MKFNRKMTIYYAGAIVAWWILFGNTFLCALVFPIPYEISLLSMLSLGALLVLHGIVGIILAFKRYIPLDLPLPIIYCIPLLILFWGQAPGYKPIPLVIALIMSCSVAVWYLIDSTREQSGTFQ